MVDLNAHEAGNGGKKPKDTYSLPSLLYSESMHNVVINTVVDTIAAV